MESESEEYLKLKFIFESPKKYLIDYFKDFIAEVDYIFAQRINQEQNGWQVIIKKIQNYENECLAKKNLIDDEFKQEMEIIIRKKDKRLIKNAEHKILKLIFLNKSIFFLDDKTKNQLVLVKDQYLSFELIELLRIKLLNKPIDSYVYDLNTVRHENCDCRKNPSKYPSNKPLKAKTLIKMKIKSMRLNTTEFTDLYTEINLNDLNELNFEEIDLTSIDDEIFEGLTSLLKLSFLSNFITKIQINTFKYLSNVRELNLAYNKINSIDDGSFKWMPNLVKLNLTQNYLHTITNKTFAGLINLEELDLYRNKIQSIDENAFHCVSNLKILNLRFNFVSRITNKTFKNLTRLKELDLSKNSIQYLDEDSFSDLKDLTLFHIHENPEIASINYIEIFSNFQKLNDKIF
jgi:hypothetical protein